MNNKIFISTYQSKNHPTNEDSICYVHKQENVIGFCVCDGVSSSLNSFITSNLVTSVFKKQFHEINPYYSSKDLHQWFIHLLQTTNEQLHQKYKEFINDSQLAATINVTIIINNNLYVFNIGDTNTYLISNEILLINQNHINKHKNFDTNNLINNENKNDLLNYFCPFSNNNYPKYYFYHNLISQNDIIMVCTDGLYQYIDLKTYSFSNNAKNDCKILTQLAIENGSTDDISIGVYYV